jgi:hypothetical protein
MSKKKWGESFLKSGMPLEHIAALTIRSKGWSVQSNIRYRREPDAPRSFEIDIDAKSGQLNRDTELRLLTECKYHDASRFWMFLPRPDPSSSVGGDEQILNTGPVMTLKQRTAMNMIGLAPPSSVGVVLSADGEKQPNAIQRATLQLANAFTPYVVSGFLYDALHIHRSLDAGWKAKSVIPMVITNAALFRMRPDVDDITAIRDAQAPEEIADKIDWTWCLYNTAPELRASNERYLMAYEKNETYAPIAWAIHASRWFLSKPRFYAIVNINALGQVLTTIQEAFAKVEMFTLRESVEKAQQFAADLVKRREEEKTRKTL